MRTRKLIERLGQKNMYVREKEKRTRNFISLEALTCMCAHALSPSVVSDSLRPHRL